jgi:hypothetical protein
MELGNATALTPAEREEAAMAIWNHEKGMAAAVIIISWLFKVCNHAVQLNSPTEPLNHRSTLLSFSTHTHPTCAKALTALYRSPVPHTQLHHTITVIWLTKRWQLTRMKKSRTFIACLCARRRHRGIAAVQAITTPSRVSQTLSALRAGGLVRRVLAA